MSYLYYPHSVVILLVLSPFQIVEEIFKIPNVVGCGEVFGVIEVVINEELKNKESDLLTVNKNIKIVLSKFNCALFTLRFASQGIEYFKGTGAAIGQGRSGTLGAFVQAISRVQKATGEEENKSEKNELWALLSKHVAIYQPEGKLYHNGEWFADILHEIPGGTDIAAAVVHQQHIYSCRQEFQTEKNKTRHCFLSQTTADFVGEFVHFWCDRLKPGRGIIQSIVFAKGFDSTSNYILIEDRYSGERFCQPGDSGAVVCRTSRNGKELYALGMLIGKIMDYRCHEYLYKDKEKHSYVALEMNSGIEYISQLYDCNIIWIPFQKASKASYTEVTLYDRSGNH